MDIILTALVFLMIGLACPYLKIATESYMKRRKTIADKADAYDDLMEFAAGHPVLPEDLVKKLFPQENLPFNVTDIKAK